MDWNHYKKLEFTGAPIPTAQENRELDALLEEGGDVILPSDEEITRVLAALRSQQVTAPVEPGVPLVCVFQLIVCAMIIVGLAVAIIFAPRDERPVVAGEYDG